MKVIFLDIDGVLNCVGTVERWGGFYDIEDKKVELLKQIIDAHPDADIVLSSTWRLTSDSAERVIEKLEMNEVRTFVDVTPDNGEALTTLGWPNKMSMYYCRGHEIAAWLSQHPEVEQYVILDDNEICGDYEYAADFDLATKMDMHFVKTSWQIGMRPEHVDKAIRILNGDFPMGEDDD